MVTTTRKASNAPRKRFQSRKAEENAPKPAPRPKKRARVVPFINPEEITEDIPTDDEEPASDAIEPPEDVSMQEYTLAVSLMLEEVSIYADTSFHKLGEFKYRKFEEDSIKRLCKATLKSKVGFDFDFGKATLGAKGVSKPNELPVSLEDASEWEKVEQLIGRWMRLHKREITVKLVMQYKRKSEDGIESDADEEPFKKGKRMVHISSLPKMLILERNQQTTCEIEAAAPH